MIVLDRLMPPTTNQWLLIRLVLVALVVCPTATVVVHKWFGWSWARAVTIDLVLGAVSIVTTYRQGLLQE